MISQDQLLKALMTASQLCMLQLSPSTQFGYQNLHMSASVQVPSELQPLLHSYQDVFHEPQELRLSRGFFGHKIPLKKGTSPINIRAYRYPLKHKYIIE